MTLSTAIEAVWRDLESARAQVLREVHSLSQAQADWRPTSDDWSIGEIVHHLTLAEVATGKLTSKLLREAAPPAPFPGGLAAFTPLPEWPPGPREAPDSPGAPPNRRRIVRSALRLARPGVTTERLGSPGCPPARP